MSDNFSIIIFSSKEIEDFSNRLHFNTALDVSLNFVASYLVLKHSTKAMGNYKYYIFSSIIFTLIMDIHLTVVYGMYTFLPTTMFCAAGLARNWGWFWGQTFNFCVLHITLGMAGGSLIVGFAYQYFSIIGSNRFFHTKLCYFLIFIGLFIYPLPTLGFYIPNINLEEAKKDILENHQELYNYFISNACNSSVQTWRFKVYVFVMFTQIGLVIFVAAIFAIKIQNKLAEYKNSISSQTMKARKQLLLALIIQMLIPVLFLVAPLVGLLIMWLFKKGNAAEASLWVIQLFSLHSCGNSIAIMAIIKPYRGKLFEWMKLALSPLKCCLSNSIFFNNFTSAQPISIAINNSSVVGPK